jgi:hypothetical protein
VKEVLIHMKTLDGVLDPGLAVVSVDEHRSSARAAAGARHDHARVASTAAARASARAGAARKDHRVTSPAYECDRQMEDV